MNMFASHTPTLSPALRQVVPGATKDGASSHVRILLCTYNGAPFLRAQLDSFLAQEHDDWSLQVQDDHSTDATRQILADFAAQHPAREVTTFEGVGKGHAANYLSILCRQSPLPIGGTVALSDQDDVWLPYRLSRARAVLAQLEGEHGTDTPILYGSRTRLARPDLTPMGLSRTVRRRPSFTNALVQNVMAGNTLMLNGAALELVKQAGANLDVPFHDWWLYLLISGAGGQVVFDDEPTLLYRQHAHNALGTPNSLRGAVKRLGMVRDTVFRQSIDRNITALNRNAQMLTQPHRRAVEVMAQRSTGNRLRALHQVWQAGIHRQGRMQSLFVFWAMMRRKI